LALPSYDGLEQLLVAMLDLVPEPDEELDVPPGDVTSNYVIA